MKTCPSLRGIMVHYGTTTDTDRDTCLGFKRSGNSIKENYALPLYLHFKGLKKKVLRCPTCGGLGCGGCPEWSPGRRGPGQGRVQTPAPPGRQKPAVSHSPSTRGESTSPVERHKYISTQIHFNTNTFAIYKYIYHYSTNDPVFLPLSIFFLHPLLYIVVIFILLPHRNISYSKHIIFLNYA